MCTSSTLVKPFGSTSSMLGKPPAARSLSRRHVPRYLAQVGIVPESARQPAQQMNPALDRVNRRLE
jgi:hypothetical protein